MRTSRHLLDLIEEDNRIGHVADGLRELAALVVTRHSRERFRLLRNVPRTATVRAHTELNISELTREVFIPLVSGYGTAAPEADSASDERLATLAPGGAGE